MQGSSDGDGQIERYTRIKGSADPSFKMEKAQADNAGIYEEDS